MILVLNLQLVSVQLAITAMGVLAYLTHRIRSVLPGTTVGTALLFLPLAPGALSHHHPATLMLPTVSYVHLDTSAVAQDSHHQVESALVGTIVLQDRTLLHPAITYAPGVTDVLTVLISLFLVKEVRISQKKVRWTACLVHRDISATR